MPTKDLTIRARVGADVKRKSEKILDELGLSMSAAINVFLKQVVLQRGIPFELRAKVPNTETRKAIEDARKGIGLTAYANVEDLFNDKPLKRKPVKPVLHADTDRANQVQERQKKSAKIRKAS